MLCTQPPPKPPPTGLLRFQPGAPSTTNGGWSTKVATTHTEGPAPVDLSGLERASVCTTVELWEEPFGGHWHGDLCRCASRCLKWRSWRTDIRAWDNDPLAELDDVPAEPLCASLRFSR
jgi:hypothetical protein